MKIEILEIVNDVFTEFIPKKSPKHTLTTPPFSNRSTSREPGEERSVPPRKHILTDMGVTNEVMLCLEVCHS
jgi:hypothetical protein